MSARKDLWRMICANGPIMYMGLVFVTALGTLNLLAMVLAEQSTGAFSVSIMVFVLLGVTGIGLAFLLWRCQVG